MNITCHCSACGATYQVGEQYAGRKIKCPKCSAAVDVPARVGPAPPQKVPPARPASPSASSSGLRTAAKIESELAPPPPPRRASPAPSHETPSQVQPGGIEIPGLSDMPKLSDTIARHSSTDHHPKKRKKKSSNTGLWLAIGLGIGGVVLVGGIVAAVVMSQNKPGTTASNPTDGGVNKAAPAVETVDFTIEWPENQRSGGKLYVDDKEVELPKSGPIKLALTKQSHKFKLVRPNYQDLEFNRTIDVDPLPYAAAWAELPKGLDGWPQDFDEALKQKKRILVFFDASDWNPACKHLIREVFSKSEFVDKVSKDYVLVHLDFPNESEAKAKVKNAVRNREIAEKFGVKDSFPTLMGFDAEGRPVGFHEGPVREGMDGVMGMLGRWHQTGLEVSGAMAAVESAAAGAAKHKAIVKVLDLLENNALDRFYQPKMKEWLAMLPPELQKRLKPVSLVEAQSWATKFLGTLERGTREQVEKLVGEFDQWKQSRKFTDANMGAGLHAMAAQALAKFKRFDEAKKKCKEGLAYDPPNDHIRDFLENFEEGMDDAAAGNERVAGLGTGFCIDSRGYVLTNHHVIRDNKSIKVRIAGQDKPVPAKVLASDAKNDIALLKVDLPQGVTLPAVALVPDVKVGTRVCCMGFPDKGRRGAGFLKSTVTVTQGIVSNAPGKGDREGDIEIDCRVNPGNSGGPLCSQQGAVVGMVKAKSLSDATRDSFGYVIPVSKLHAFLKIHADKLPKEGLTAIEAPTKRLEWDEVCKNLTPSVVNILNYQ